MTWTSSETLPAAGHRRQYVFEPLQGAEVPLRPGLLRDPEHLGRLGAAELFEVSQREHLPVNGDPCDSDMAVRVAPTSSDSTAAWSGRPSDRVAAIRERPGRAASDGGILQRTPRGMVIVRPSSTTLRFPSI